MFDLTDKNTFRLASKAQKVIVLNCLTQLPQLADAYAASGQDLLIIGGGSNLILAPQIQQTVVLNQLRGIQTCREDDQHVWVEVAAGENWDAWVRTSLAQYGSGLENLALIPGCVGAAPVQNVGAYGLEVGARIHAVQVYDYARRTAFTLSPEACVFAYRHSVFKTAKAAHWVVTSVVFRLDKQWQPVLSYQGLNSLDPGTSTPQDVYETVCAIRRAKLPDPAELGNCGSFFVNPVLSAQEAQRLKCQYPQLVQYPQADGRVKLSAAWLIEHSGLKGHQMGDVRVYDCHALCLVNVGQASSDQLLKLVAHIQKTVQARFWVMLHPEPVFVGFNGASLEGVTL